jgi:hypothetical protein
MKFMFLLLGPEQTALLFDYKRAAPIRQVKSGLLRDYSQQSPFISNRLTNRRSLRSATAELDW